MNERIKELRKTLGLSGEQFGEPLGLKRAAISNLENGRANLTEQAVLAICYAYNVNENWLRTGDGSMFNQSCDGFFSDLKKQYSLTDFQINLIKNYLKLTDKERASIDNFITSCAKNPNDKEI